MDGTSGSVVIVEVLVVTIPIVGIKVLTRPMECVLPVMELLPECLYKEVVSPLKDGHKKGEPNNGFPFLYPTSSLPHSVDCPIVE